MGVVFIKRWCMGNYGKLLFAVIMAVFISLSLSACGGGGGGLTSSTDGTAISSGGSGGSAGDKNSSDDTSNSSDIALSDCSINSKIISKSNPKLLVFSCKVKSSQFYNMDIYLSNDDVLDSSDKLLAQDSSDKGSCTFSLNPSDADYQTLLEAYGGVHYIIFDAYISSKHSIQSVPVVLKNRWTVAVYMDGDNSLGHSQFHASTAVDDDLNEIEQAGSDKNINIVAQIDTYSDTTKRYFIKPNDAKLIEDLGELNMGNKQTLANFGSWVINNYPADHYLLVLWDHGGGFKGVVPEVAARDIFEDKHPQSIMSVPEMNSALSDIKNSLGHKIDIIGFDDCLMNMLEVAYEIQDTADYMVGSENTEPYNGWPYDIILNYLKANANISAVNLSKEIVKAYTNSYTPYYDATQSAIDLSKIDNIAKAANQLANALISGLDKSTIKTVLQNDIFNSVQRFDDGFYDGISADDDSYADLYNLSLLIKQKLPSYAVQSQAVTDAIDNAMIANGDTGDSVINASGLSIWFPDPNIYARYNWDYDWNHYNELSFSKNSKWDEFITKLWSN